MEIVIEGLNYVYGVGTPYERHALKDINLHIPAGEFVAIIGHTGSGKSTLIQHFNGLLRPTSGRVRVGSFEVSAKKKNLRELRKAVGMVFQYPEHQLFAETVEEDVAFGPANFDLPKELVQKRVKEALALVGLPYEKFARRSPFRLSGGQMRRVAIAGVLAMQPKVLVLDEPTAGLDPQGRRSILDTIYRLHKAERMTTVLVTHSMEDAARYADRLVVMHEGKVMLEGRPADVFACPERLRQAGLDIPEITKLILSLNERLSDPLPPHLFRLEDLVREIRRRFAAKRGAEG
ncbi:energy-coupling factor ABC transporter ATP-binding protein [Bacillaceae bacterium]